MTTIAGTTLYLAEYEGAEAALFTTPDAAREYCADFANTEARGQSWDWMPENGGVQQQAWVDADTDRPLHLTGGVVTALAVDAENPNPCSCRAETVHQKGCLR